MFFLIFCNVKLYKNKFLDLLKLYEQAFIFFYLTEPNTTLRIILNIFFKITIPANFCSSCHSALVTTDLNISKTGFSGFGTVPKHDKLF